MKKNMRAPLTSTRSRLIAVITLVLAVAFIGTSAVNYHVARNALKTAVVQRELPLTGDTIYSKIQADLVRPIYVSSQMAHDTFLRDWTINGEANAEQVRRFLDEIRLKYGFFTAFFVSEKSRLYYHFNGISKKVRGEDPRDEWFFRVRGMKNTYEINVDPNQQQDDMITIFINYKVFDYEGQVIGVTGVGLNLHTVSTLIDQYRDEFGRDVFFVERSGRITLHPDPTIAYRKHLRDIPGMAAIAEQITQGDRGAYEYNSSDGTILLTTRFIPELNWVLIVGQKEALATAAANRGLIASILVGLVAILITGFVIGTVINHFQRQLEQRATIDPLTNLYNRQVFDIALGQAIERGRRNQTDLSLLLVDFDQFKQINDRFGHLTGDAILQRAATLILQSVRKADIVARWGGEEFAVLMENCDLDSAVRSAETLRMRIAEGLTLPDAPDMVITASFGVTALNGDDDVATLFSRADTALYRAKQTGRNRVCRDDPSSPAAVSDSLTVPAQ